MLRRSVCLRRFTRAALNVALDGPNLCRGEVFGKRRHSELPQSPALNNPLKHLVRGLAGVTQVRHQPAAHYVAPVAARTERGEQIRSLIDLRPRYRKLEGRHGNGRNGLLDSFERRGPSDRKNRQSPARRSLDPETHRSGPLTNIGVAAAVHSTRSIRRPITPTFNGYQHDESV